MLYRTILSVKKMINLFNIKDIFDVEKGMKYQISIYGHLEISLYMQIYLLWTVLHLNTPDGMSKLPNWMVIGD